MSQFKQTEDGDLEITNNQFTLVSGTDELRQKLKQELRLFLGEWFLNLLEGVPYHQLVFQKGVPATVVNDIFRQKILSIKGVSGLNSFSGLDLDRATRQATLDFEVSSPDGNVDLSIPIP